MFASLGRAKASLLRLFDWRVWAATGPLLVMFLLFWGVAVISLGLLTRTIKFWEYFIYGFALSLTGYWVILAGLLRLTRRWWPAAAAAGFYLFIYGVNCGMLYHAGTLLEHYYLQILDWTNWTLYLTKWVYVLAAVFVALCVWTALALRRFSKSISELPLWGLVVLLAVLWVLPQLQAHGLFRPTYVVAKVAAVHHAGAWQEGQTDQVRRLAQNPLKILAQALFSADQALTQRPMEELSQCTNLLAAWGLPLGAREYPPLNVGPFEQIIIFATESLSFDFLSPYNRSLPADSTPFYGSEEIRPLMFQNYWTTSLPTQYGLLVSYNSHPNAAGLLAGDCELSIIKMLNRAGYHTAFLKSDSETWLNDRSVFARIGFQEIVGMESWTKDPKKRPYVEGRGLMDRALYDTVLEYMEKYRGRKLVVHVCGQDTHSPGPREYYGSLQYPQTPAGLTNVPSAEAQDILKGVFRHDYDIGRTIRAMRERGLLTERTLVVLTADHNYPPAACLRAIPGFPAGQYYTRIPLVFLSGQRLPEATLEQLHAQLDLAPSLAHLLGLPVQPGWWGRSVFLTNAVGLHVARVQDNLVVAREGDTKTIALAAPQGEAEQGLVRLFQSSYGAGDPGATKR